MNMSPRSLGPWTTSLDSGSRLELSAFWRRRMQALGTLPLAPGRLKRPTLAVVVIAAALFAATPLVDFSPAHAAEQDQSAAAPPTASADAPAAQDEEFVARFSNGVEVELMGVSSAPSTDESWWRPDGSRLAAAPYKPFKPVRLVWDSPIIREFC